MSKYRDLSQIGPLCHDLRAEGKTVVLCHGVFDLLHPGHIRHLEAAKQMGDILVVTITADNHVNKGPGRPAFTSSLRVASLSALASVDYVCIVHEESAISAIEAVQPGVYVKGHEYSEEQADTTGQIAIERELVEKLGGRIAYTNDLTFSSSTLINTFFGQHSREVTEWIDYYKSRHSLSETLSWLTEINSLEVAVVGDAIIDVYTQCNTLGVASKEPVLCLNRESSTAHLGGSLAVARHCAGLGARVNLITTMSSKDVRTEVADELKDVGVETLIEPSDPLPTVRKERIIESSSRTRVLELYEMAGVPPSADVLSKVAASLRNAARESDVTLVADYGHGLMQPQIVEAALSARFLAANAQANAGNLGLNSLDKYPRADFVTLNGKEALLEGLRKQQDAMTFVPQLQQRLGTRCVLITRGSEGLEVLPATGDPVVAPALAPYVEDKVGAGDAVLAVTALLVRIGAPDEVVAFVGNVVGAWAVTFVGNEQSLRVGTLKRQISAILK